MIEPPRCKDGKRDKPHIAVPDGNEQGGIGHLRYVEFREFQLTIEHLRHTQRNRVEFDSAGSNAAVQDGARPGVVRKAHAELNRRLSLPSSGGIAGRRRRATSTSPCRQDRPAADGPRQPLPPGHPRWEKTPLTCRLFHYVPAHGLVPPPTHFTASPKPRTGLRSVPCLCSTGPTFATLQHVPNGVSL